MRRLFGNWVRKFILEDPLKVDQSDVDVKVALDDDADMTIATDVSENSVEKQHAIDVFDVKEEVIDFFADEMNESE